MTGSLNRLNTEIKQMCVKKPSLSSLNVDSGRDLGASPVCRSSSRLGLVVSSTALERRRGPPAPARSSSAELRGGAPAQLTPLLPPALAGSPGEAPL